MIGIYKVTNQINGKVYIGQAVNIKRRWGVHRRAYKDKASPQYTCLFYKAIRKYGIENFTFEVVEECEKDQLDRQEKYWIAYYNSFLDRTKGYNETSGGQNAPHFMKLSLETLNEIVDLLISSNMTLQEIAKKYNVSHITIKDINQGHSWYNPDLNYPLRATKTKIIHYCIDCGAEITKGATRCKECSLKNRQKVERPTAEELLQILKNNQGNFSAVGRQFGVTDNAIRKWCKQYNLPFHSSDYK